MPTPEVQSWDDRQLALLRPNYPDWDIWAVRSVYPKPHTTWCARPKGHPVATINTDSPEHLIELLSAGGQPLLPPGSPAPPAGEARRLAGDLASLH